MLDRLVRRAIFAKPDAVMGHNVDHTGTLQRRKPDCGAAIIAKHQECAAIGDEPPVQRHSVHRRRHAKFTDAVIDIATRIIILAQ